MERTFELNGSSEKILALSNDGSKFDSTQHVEIMKFLDDSIVDALVPNLFINASDSLKDLDLPNLLKMMK
jgi:hypothetical protein